MGKSKKNVPHEEVHTATPVHPGYPQGMPPTGNVVTAYPAQPAGAVVLPRTLGPVPCTVVCPVCHETVQTDVEVVSTTKTHLFALLLAALGCCLCCWIPYCTDSLRDKHHYCPNCKAFIGAYDR